MGGGAIFWRGGVWDLFGVFRGDISALTEQGPPRVTGTAHSDGAFQDGFVFCKLHDECGCPENDPCYQIDNSCSLGNDSYFLTNSLNLLTT